MVRKIFAICDLEEKYVVRLTDYLNEKGTLPFEVLAFTNLDSLVRYARDHPIEILLISTQAMSEEVKNLSAARTIILSEGEEPDLSGESSIFKYQSSEMIAKEVMQLYSGAETQVDMADCDVTGIYSPVGRCGKTLFALTMAQLMGERARTLYVNLENFSGFETLFGKTFRSDLTDLVYLSQQEGASLGLKLESIAEHMGNMDFIPPAFFPGDLRQIGADRWQLFLAQTAAAGDYKKMVLDIGTEPGDVPALLRLCTRIYMPIMPDPISRSKVTQFEKNLEALSMKDILKKTVRLYLPKVETRSAGVQLLDELARGKMGQFVRQLSANVVS